MQPMDITTMLLDFGGVVAEEGFHEGLLAIGKRNGLDPETFFRTVDRLIFDSGYLTGQAPEAAFWDAVRIATGVAGADEGLKEEILPRFIIRAEMLDAADRLRKAGLTVAMLSDQTDWLEEIDRRTGLFRHFDRVFNSYCMHKSKRDASVFDDVCTALGARPAAVLFVDDNAGHIERAASRGLQVHHFTAMETFLSRVEDLLRKAGGT